MFQFSKGQKLLLTSPLTLRTSYSVGRIPAGTVIEVQQVDDEYRQVLIENVWISKGVVESSSVLANGSEIE